MVGKRYIVDSSLLDQDDYRYKGLTKGVVYRVIDIAPCQEVNDTLLAVRDNNGITVYVSSVYFCEVEELAVVEKHPYHAGGYRLAYDSTYVYLMGKDRRFEELSYDMQVTYQERQLAVVASMRDLDPTSAPILIEEENVIRIYKRL